MEGRAKGANPANNHGLPRWELRGVGHLEAQLLGDRAAVGENGEGTIVIGTWQQDELAELLGALIVFGFELRSVRRLDGQLVAT